MNRVSASRIRAFPVENQAFNWRTLAWHVRCSRGEHMDIPRPENKKRKRIRQIAIGSGTARRARHRHDRLWRGSSRPHRRSTPIRSTPARSAQGELLRQTRGPGTLVPRAQALDRRAVGGPSRALLVRPGAVVEADTILIGAVESRFDAPGRGGALRARDREGHVRGVRARRCAARSSIRRQPSRKRARRTNRRGCRPKPSARRRSLPSSRCASRS